MRRLAIVVSTTLHGIRSMRALGIECAPRVDTARMVKAYVANQAQFDRLLFCANQTLCTAYRSHDAAVLRFLHEPFICADWSALERLTRVREHAAIFEALKRRLAAFTDGRLRLEPPGLGAPLEIGLSPSTWSMREGLLALHADSQGRRLYTLTFTFVWRGGSPTILIGGIQGACGDEGRQELKTWAKHMHGLRIRDLLINVLRMIARGCHIPQILGVSDASHYDNWFRRNPGLRARLRGGIRPLEGPAGNHAVDHQGSIHERYVSIWEQNGGTAIGADFHTLGCEIPPIRLEDLPSRKRAMYRRRQQMLDDIAAGLQRALATGLQAAAIMVTRQTADVAAEN